MTGKEGECFSSVLRAEQTGQAIQRPNLRLIASLARKLYVPYYMDEAGQKIYGQHKESNQQSLRALTFVKTSQEQRGQRVKDRTKNMEGKQSAPPLQFGSNTKHRGG